MVSTRKQSQRDANAVELADRTAKRQRTKPNSSAAIQQDGMASHGEDLTISQNDPDSHGPQHREVDSHSLAHHSAPLTKSSHSDTIGVAQTGSSRASVGADDVHSRKHTRFGSEDPDIGQKEDAVPATIHQATTATLNAPMLDEGDSSDEAPEAVSAAKGHESARVAHMDVTKALQSQRRATKEARRKNDLRLKKQASAARKPSQRPDATSLSVESRQTTDKLVQDLLSAEELPEFLPAEILDAEPAETRALSAYTAGVTRKKKLFPDMLRPYKDVVAGDRVIRVLNSSASSLPPRTSKVSMNVRETWLNGSRGALLNGAGHRKPLHSGFLKRRGFNRPRN